MINAASWADCEVYNFSVGADETFRHQGCLGIAGAITVAIKVAVLAVKAGGRAESQEGYEGCVTLG